MFSVFEDSKEFYGKVIYADRLLYRHYGIGSGNGRVIHFDGHTSEAARVRESSEQEFSEGSKIYVCYRISPSYSPGEIVSRAQSKIGSDFGGYDAVDNNCEHFTSWCAKGIKSSVQVFFKNDEQDIVEKAIDRIAEPGRRICRKIDDTIEGTLDFLRRLFN